MVKSRNLFASLPFAPIIGGMFAGVAAILVGATPYWLFVRAIAAGGLPSVVPALNPPLGDTARLVAMAVAALIAGLAAYAVALVIEAAMRRSKSQVKARGAAISAATIDETSAAQNPMRRPPLFADSELGAPLMSDEAFEHARDELILDAPVAEGDALLADTDGVAELISELALVEAIADVRSVEAIEPNEPEPTSLRAKKAVPIEMLPVAALMARLEQAIAARPHGMPPLRNLGAFRVAN